MTVRALIFSCMFIAFVPSVYAAKDFWYNTNDWSAAYRQFGQPVDPSEITEFTGSYQLVIPAQVVAFQSTNELADVICPQLSIWATDGTRRYGSPNGSRCMLYGIRLAIMTGYKRCQDDETFDVDTLQCVPLPKCNSTELITGPFPYMNGTACNEGFSCSVDNSTGGPSNPESTYWSTLTPPQQTGQCPFEREAFTEYANQACPVGFTRDPVTGDCVCQDGVDCGSPPTSCTTADECFSEASDQCVANGSELMNFEYFGGSNYASQCGFRNNECPSGQSWNAPEQLCITDSDGDGTPDPYDPEPDNPDENGDSDGDGVPDSQDSHPNDANIWNNYGDTIINNPVVTGNPVNPVGEGSFNDTAIVSALNEIISNTNGTNTQLEKLNQGQTAQTNTLNNGLGELNSSLGDIKDSLEPVDGTTATNEAIEQFNKSASELGIREIESTDTQFVNDVANIFQNSSCENPTFGEQTLDLCQHAPRIVPFLEAILWLLTLTFIWHEIHTTMRRQ